MTAEDEQDLRELGVEVAGAMQSPFEPVCVAHAFAAPVQPGFVLTMQGWIDLAAARSPILVGKMPETLDELEAAAVAFGASVEDLSLEEAVDVTTAMRRAVADAFAMQCQMKRPGAASDREEGGFGEWLPIYACLVTQCGIPRAEARAMDVREAFALIAAMRWNEGWSVAGEPYAARDIDDLEEKGAH